MGYFIFDQYNNYKCWVATQELLAINSETTDTVVEGNFIEHPKLENGNVVQDTAVVTELEKDNIRRQRNSLLNESDDEMMKLLDNSTSWSDFSTQRAAWKTYRQALRDVPTQAGFPGSVTWPTKPS